VALAMAVARAVAVGEQSPGDVADAFLLAPAKMATAPPRSCTFDAGTGECTTGRARAGCPTKTAVFKDVPMTVLASYPGSGSTLSRLLIEQATGVVTGSGVYKDPSLLNAKPCVTAAAAAVFVFVFVSAFAFHCARHRGRGMRTPNTRAGVSLPGSCRTRARR